MANQAALEHVPAERHVLIAAVDRLVGRSDEQHAIVDCLKYLLENPLESSAAAEDTAIEVLAPKILLSVSTLKAPIIFQNLRQVLRSSVISLEQLQGLFVPQAVTKALYDGYSVILRNAREQISNFHMCRGSSVPSSTRAQVESSGSPSGNNRPSQDTVSARNVDSASKYFREDGKFRGIPRKLISRPEAQRLYLTYRDPKSSRADRVKVVFLVLKGTAPSFWEEIIHGCSDITQVAQVFKRLENIEDIRK